MPDDRPPHRPFTQPWADAYRDAINASERFRARSAGWAWPLALVLDPAPALGYPEPLAVVLDLAEGRCRSALVLPAGQASAPFTIGGEYAAWKEVVRGQTDPVAAIMRRRLRLAGQLSTLLAHVETARALVATAAEVPTEFPDEGE